MPTTNYAMALLRLRPLRRLRPLLLSTSICLMDRGGLDRGIWRLPTIHPLCHIHWMYFNSKSVLLVTWPRLFCPSWRGILLCCSPEGFFTFFPWRVVWGQRSGMSMCTDCKALRQICNLWNWAIQIKWIELNIFPSMSWWVLDDFWFLCVKSFNCSTISNINSWPMVPKLLSEKDPETRHGPIWSPCYAMHLGELLQSMTSHDENTQRSCYLWMELT